MINRTVAHQIVRSVLAADLGCSEAALLAEGVTVGVAAGSPDRPIEERPGRRRFPERARPLWLVTLGAGVVVSCHPDRSAWLQQHLGHLSRDEIFSAPTIARLARYVEPDGQILRGPNLTYACSEADLRPIDVPEGITIVLGEGAGIVDRYRRPGFANALAGRVDTLRPDVLATVATRGGEVVGVAGASADCDRLWQIGVDVIPSFQGQGIGRALVGRLTEAVLARGRVPYYSTTVSHVRSRTLASSLGYWPAWVQLDVREVAPAASPPSATAAAGEAPRLTDGVVLLDAHTLADIAAHLAGEDEEQARRFGWYPAHSTPETVRAAIEHWQEQWRTSGPTRAFAARDVATGSLVGGCEVRLQGDGLAHLSYWVFPRYRGRGIASRAVRLACGYAFGELGLERIEVYVEPDNLASRGVARKAGFVEEGLLRGHARFGAERRDVVLYARLATDPPADLP